MSSSFTLSKIDRFINNYLCTCLYIHVGGLYLDEDDHHGYDYEIKSYLKSYY